MLELEYADTAIPLNSIPHVRIRPVSTPGYRHYRLVIREYGHTDPRWSREKSLMEYCGDAMGFPYVRSIQESEHTVVTLEAGGMVMLRDFITRAALRRRAETSGAPVPILAPLVIVVLFRTIAEALARIHRRGLCYRSLSDETLMIDENGMRFLTTACVGPSESALVQQHMDTLGVTRLYRLETMAPVQMTTAPERLEGRTVPEGDVYGLGVLMYLALLGAPPFPTGQHGPEYRWHALHTRLDRLHRQLQPLPGGAGLVHLLRQCLMAQPEERPPASTLAELLFQIEYGVSRDASRTDVDLVVRLLLDGRFGAGSRGARQQHAWMRLYGQSSQQTHVVSSIALPVSPSGASGTQSARAWPRESPPSVPRRVYPIRRWRDRWRVAWRVLRTGWIE